MSVESFDPGMASTELTDAVVAQLLSLAGELNPLQPDEFVVASELRGQLAFSITGDQWAGRLEPLQDHDLVALVQFFTLMEHRYPGWEAGAKSAVIPMVRELKNRKAYSSEITRWIKSNTDNKFLPHGSLSDLL